MTDYDGYATWTWRAWPISLGALRYLRPALPRIRLAERPEGCFYYGSAKDYETDLLPRLAYYEEN